MRSNLTGKSVVITGASSGIGFAAAAKFVQLGAFVIGVGRSETRNMRAKQSIIDNHPEAQIEFLLSDLAEQQHVMDLAPAISLALTEHHFEHLDILINNAGVYLETKQHNQDGIEKTFAVNHLAAFVLTYQLLPLLRQSPNGRVITVSSYAHRKTPLNFKRISNPWPYIGLLAYKRSKLCNILFTKELNRRCPEIDAFAVDPGLVNTGIGSKGNPGISDFVWRRRRQKGAHPDVPVETLLLLAEDEHIDPATGDYYRDCQVQKPSRNARREDPARELWELSCQLTGINWS